MVQWDVQKPYLYKKAATKNDKDQREYDAKKRKKESRRIIYTQQGRGRGNAWLSNLHGSDSKISYVEGDLASHRLYSGIVFEHRKLRWGKYALREQEGRACTQITLRSRRCQFEHKRWREGGVELTINIERNSSARFCSARSAPDVLISDDSHEVTKKKRIVPGFGTTGIQTSRTVMSLNSPFR